MSEMNKSVGERIAEIRRQLSELKFDDATIQQMRDKLAAHPELSKAFGEAYGKYLNNESIRPTLGNEMQIFYMRERQTLTFLLFPELLKLEYEVSRMIGELVMADQMGGYTLPEIMKNNAPLAVRDKYAIEEVVEADDKHAIYRHYECADCYGVPNIGMKICAYEAGTAAGCFGAAMGKRCEVVETKCCANGDPYCEFLVTVVED